jgi:hypothetical protein
MRNAGKWIGWGLGPPPDDNPKIKVWKSDLSRKFSYAKALLAGDTSTIFTEALATTVMEAQTRWGFPATGIIDAKFQYKMGWAKEPPRISGPRGTLYTCQGTVPSDMWWGPQADVAHAVEDLYYFQPIAGRYQPFPMNNSIDEEKAFLRYEIERRPLGDPINAFGYSQGAIVVSEVYQEMKQDSDPLHYRFNDWRRAATIGNPCRELGVNNGNKFAKFGSGYPDLGKNSRGIMEDKRRMVDTPDWWLDFAHPKDMYCDTPNNDAGEDQTAICMIIMGNWFGGPDSIFSQVIEVVQRPLPELFAMMQAIINAGMFFGGGIKPHITYDVGPAIAYLRSESGRT